MAAPLIRVTLALDPRGWARPRVRVVTPRDGRPFAHFFKDTKTRSFEDALAIQARVAMRRKGLQPLEGPLAVRLFAMMPVPVSWSARERAAALSTTFHTSKPDHDNIAGMLDAFNKIVWLDDAQVCRSLVVKEYAERPGLIVEVFRLP